MHINHTCVAIFVSIFLSCLAACGGGDGSDAGIVTILRLSGGTGSTTITANDGQGEFVIIPYSAPTQTGISGSATYRVNVSAQSSNTSKLTSATKSFYTPRASQVPETVLQRLQQRVQFENEQDTLFRQAITQYTKARQNKKKPALRYRQPQSTQAFTSTINIFSPYNGEKNTTITGNLLASNSLAALYLDSRDAGDISPTDGATMLERFNVISMPRVRQLVGTEGDINGDGGLVIFLSTKISSGVLGFFRPIDMLPDGVDPATRSNEMEIVFAALPQTTGGDDLFHATLAHEYFHLVNFAIKSLPSFQDSGGTTILLEELALNEGQAHCIEDLTGWGGGDTYAVAAVYLNNVSLASIAGSVHPDVQNNGNDDSLARRGGMMLFLRYLFEQEGSATYSSSDVADLSGGGVTFFRALTTSALVGTPNIAAAAGINFADTMGRWAAALYLDGTALTDDSRYNYQAIETDPFTNGPRGFNLRGARAINGGSITNLDGPNIIATLSNSSSSGTSSDGTLFLSGAAFITLQSAANSHTTIDYSTTSASIPGLAIITLP